MVICAYLCATLNDMTMKTNAIAVANYFVDLSQKYKVPIHLLGLVKRVYIAHGLALAYRHKGLIDPRFDKVEAWKYGPVIPSVYLFAFTCVYMTTTLIVVYLCGLGIMYLSDAIIITLLTTTLAEVIGMFNFVARYLFHHK